MIVVNKRKGRKKSIFFLGFRTMYDRVRPKLKSCEICPFSLYKAAAES